MAATPYPIPKSTRETAVLAGNGTAGPYGPTVFKVFDTADVTVWLRLDGEAHFSDVTGDVAVTKTAGAALDSVSVTFDGAISAADEFVLQATRRHSRSVAVTKGGAIAADELERELSKQGSVISELRRDVDRAFALPPGSSGGGVIPALADATTLMWDADAGAFVQGPSQAELIAAEGVAAVANSAVQPGDLGSAAYQSAAAFATAAQGATADTAVQPGDLAAVATSGDYGDLSGKPLTVPAGGTTAQALTKQSNASGDYAWQSLPGGGDMLAATYDPTAVAGDAFDSANHAYDNATSGLAAATVQDAIDELADEKQRADEFSATTALSGATVDLAVPAGATHITIAVGALSLNATDNPMLRLGTSVGIETGSVYNGSFGAVYNSPSGPVAGVDSTGFIFGDSIVAGRALSGHIELTLLNPATNAWVMTFVGGRRDGTATLNIAGGDVSLSGPLTTIRLLTAGGNSFDSGAVRARYRF